MRDAATLLSEPVNEQQKAGEQQRQEEKRQDTMSPAPPPGEVRLGLSEVRHDVDVREVGPHDQRCGPECGPTSQATARERDADQSVADRIYSSLASMSSWTFPCRAPETGQPFLAASAAWAKPV